MEINRVVAPIVKLVTATMKSSEMRGSGGNLHNS